MSNSINWSVFQYKLKKNNVDTMQINYLFNQFQPVYFWVFRYKIKKNNAENTGALYEW